MPDHGRGVDVGLVKKGVVGREKVGQIRQRLVDVQLYLGANPLEVSVACNYRDDVLALLELVDALEGVLGDFCQESNVFELGFLEGQEQARRENGQ